MKYPLTTKSDAAARIWAGLVEGNADDYGSEIAKVTSELGKNLDAGMDCMTAEHEAVKDSGISGFMAGVMAKNISELHPRGEEFRKYWNEKFGSSATDGTVNPALVTIE